MPRQAVCVPLSYERTTPTAKEGVKHPLLAREVELTIKGRCDGPENPEDRFPFTVEVLSQRWVSLDRWWLKGAIGETRQDRPLQPGLCKTVSDTPYSLPMWRSHRTVADARVATCHGEMV